MEKARAAEAEVGDEEARTEARSGDDGSRSSDTDDASSNSVCTHTHTHTYKHTHTQHTKPPHTHR